MGWCWCFGCCGGFKALEFWMLWVSIVSAGFACSTVFDISTLNFDDKDKDSSTKYTNDISTPYPDTPTPDPTTQTEIPSSVFEIVFFLFSIIMAFFFLLFVLLVFHCFPSKKRIANRGRKMHMIRTVQWVKLFVFVATLLFFHVTGDMKYKENTYDKKKKKYVKNDLFIGQVLLGCEFASIVVELLILREALHPTRKRAVFAKTFADVMVSAMVASQIVKVDQFYFLGAAIVTSFLYAIFVAFFVSEPIKIEPYSSVIGFGGGLLLFVVLNGTEHFQNDGDIVAYTLLFAFNFALPMIKKKYEEAPIEPAYEKSYRRSATPMPLEQV